MLGVWGMPVGLVEAAALHHAPSHTATNEISLLTAVHVANVLAHEQSPRADGIPSPQFDESYLLKLGLPTTVDDWQKLLSGETSVASPELEYSSQTNEEAGSSIEQNTFTTPAAIKSESRTVKAVLAVVVIVLIVLLGWLTLHH
jgi:hypothetical protein